MMMSHFHPPKLRVREVYLKVIKKCLEEEQVLSQNRRMKVAHHHLVYRSEFCLDVVNLDLFLKRQRKTYQKKCKHHSRLDLESKRFMYFSSLMTGFFC